MALPTSLVPNRFQCVSYIAGDMSDCSMMDAHFTSRIAICYWFF